MVWRQLRSATAVRSTDGRPWLRAWAAPERFTRITAWPACGYSADDQGAGEGGTRA